MRARIYFFKEVVLVLRKRRILGIAGSIALAAIAGSALFVFAGGSGVEVSAALFSKAPLNPAFVNWVKDREAGKPWPLYTREGRPLGLIPPPADFSDVAFAAEPSRPVAYPASYDLRSKNKLTPIKDQGNCGSCWAFATFGSLESFLKPKANYDFSEQNLIDNHGFDFGPCDGGHLWMSAAYLARWAGPGLEGADPYQYAVPVGIPVKRHVQEILFLPVRTGPQDNAKIKDAVMKYGAVAVSMAWSSSAYNSATDSYFYNGSSWVGGHAVCVVGWNDNYSKTRFKTKPAGNGAFIVRNSWGKNWGQGGYFYVSYYDSFFGKANANGVVKAEPVNNYRTVYQYDPLGWVSSWGSKGSNTCWMANIFKAGLAGKLKAVGFYVRSTSNTYQIYVYTNVKAGQPRSGKLMKTKKGTLKTPGYFTIKFGTPYVPLVKNQKFAIVVKLTSKGTNYPVCCEERASGYSNQAKAAAGQSYLSAQGTFWTDLTTIQANTNVCLKGFTQR
jgi:C1A family cysteine protease